MYSNYEYLLLKRFLFSKKTDGYISIFSWFSVIGIMIGVSVIIIVMSVMNGFREELTNRLLGINGHINIYSSNNETITSFESEEIINFNNNSYIFFPMIETQALIISGEDSKGIFVRSYRSSDLMNKKIISENILSGKIYSDKSNEILIGNVIANKLNLKIGNKVKIAIPKTDKTIFGNIPRFKTLVVSGIFSVGMYEYDSNFIFSSPYITRKLLLLDEGSFTHIEIESITETDYSIDGTMVNFRVELEDGRTATFDYDILTNQYEHTIEDDWNTTTVNPKNNPLKDMLLSVFDDSAHLRMLTTGHKKLFLLYLECS